MSVDVKQIGELVEKESSVINRIRTEIHKVIVGQEALIDGLMLALLCNNHVLIEGVPGLAKTLSVTTLAQMLQASFQRIQFTPDLLPADVIGTLIYNPKTGDFTTKQGPIFANIILADEINRAPAKVQSALLEAMAERQITVGKVTYPLPELFMVMATQNPIEQEGTYPLPEAQLDRFLMHVSIDYPEASAEKQILQLARQEAKLEANESTIANEKISQQSIFDARKEVLDIHMADELEEYLLQLVLATRNPATYGDDLANWSLYGASPRASIGLDRCARAHAWLDQRDFVSPDDIQAVAFDILRHRVILSYEAEADGITPDSFIHELITRVAVP